MDGCWVCALQTAHATVCVRGRARGAVARSQDPPVRRPRLSSVAACSLPQEATPLPLPSVLLWQQTKQLLSQLRFSGSQVTFPLSRSLPLRPKVDTMGSLRALLCLLSLCPGRSRERGGVGREGPWVRPPPPPGCPRWKQPLCFPFLPPLWARAFLLPHVCVLSPSHRLGCSSPLLPAEREHLGGQLHPQPWLGPWECPRLLLPPGPVPRAHVQAVPEQRPLADPAIHPADKGGLQT